MSSADSSITLLESPKERQKRREIKNMVCTYTSIVLRNHTLLESKLVREIMLKVLLP